MSPDAGDPERRAARTAELRRELQLGTLHDPGCAGDGQCSCGLEQVRDTMLAFAERDVPDEVWAQAMAKLRALRRAHRLQQGRDSGDVH